MKVTVEVYRILKDRTDQLKAVTNVILEDSEGDRFVIKNVRIMEGEHGLFVSLPSRRNVNNEYKEICYPLTGGLRKRMSEEALKAYQAAVASDKQDNPSPDA